MSRILKSNLGFNLRRFASTEASTKRNNPGAAVASLLSSPDVQALMKKGASGEQAASSSSTATFAPTPAGKLASSVPAQLPRLEPVEDPLLHQFSRLIMRDGKLLTAQKTLETCLNQIRAATNEDPLPLLKRAVDLASPQVRTVQHKLTATKRITVPLPITDRRRTRTGITWIVDASYKKRAQEKVFGKRLASEVLSVLEGTSEVLKKKEDLHKAATIARCVHLLNQPQAHMR